MSDDDVTTDAVAGLNASVGIDFTDPKWIEPPPALAVLAMRERAAAWMDSQALSDDELQQGYCFTPAYPAVAASSIRALPTTFTDAELLAAAMQLPDVRALVEALRKIVIENTIQQGGGMSDPHIGRCAQIALAALAAIPKGKDHE